MAIVVKEKQIEGEENTLYIQEKVLEKILIAILSVVKNINNPTAIFISKILEKGFDSFVNEIKRKKKVVIDKYKIVLIK